MLLVRTKIGLSPIHGIGIFATEFIPNGTVIWEITPGFDLELSEEDINKLPDAQREQVRNYSFLSVRLGKFIFCADNGRFFNHSDNPNTFDRTDSSLEETIALRDINEGEELTGDYKVYDSDWKRKLGG